MKISYKILNWHLRVNKDQIFTVLLLCELKCLHLWRSVAASENQQKDRCFEILQNALFILLSKHVAPYDSPFSALAELCSMFATERAFPAKPVLSICRLFNVSWGGPGAQLCSEHARIPQHLCPLLHFDRLSSCCEHTLRWCRHHNRKHLGLS